MTLPLPSSAARREAARCLRSCRAPRVRPLEQFVAEEIVIPEGRFRGLRFRHERQPYARVAYRAIDSGRWTRFVFPGCVQSGKSFHFWAIPAVYHVCEHAEAVVIGAPDVEDGFRKYRQEIEPIIRRSRFAWILPDRGAGSRGGKTDEINFKNGAAIKFMPGRGGDASRSSYTARVVICTEIDKYDRPTPGSREADPITQMEARSDSWDLMDRVAYLECTVSIDTGRIWTEYTAGTESRLVAPCPHCGKYVSPEREHLVGWKDASTELDAFRSAYFACPACAEAITPDQRRRMALAAVLVHRGQKIDRRGRISGDEPDVITLGFRWGAFWNLFWEPGGIGLQEWKSDRAEDNESSERKLRQFVWTLPHEPPQLRLTTLDSQTLRRRFNQCRKGFLPAEAEHFTLGIDIGKWISWWIAIAWLPDASSHVVDYGELTIPSDTMGVERAILAALREFRDDTIEKGWPSLADENLRLPEVVMIDARYQGDQPGDEAVYSFCRESGQRYLPLLGYGIGKRYQGRYRPRTKIDQVTRHLGRHYHIDWLADHAVFCCQINVDAWKLWLQQRLETPPGEPGAMTFYASADRNEHGKLSRHLAAEQPEEEFIPGVGNVIRWRQTHKQNHYGDTGVYACVGGHFAGVRLVGDPEPAIVVETEAEPLTTPDGRPYLITQR